MPASTKAKNPVTTQVMGVSLMDLGGGVTVTILRTRGDAERLLRAVGDWHWGGELNLQVLGKPEHKVTRYM